MAQTPPPALAIRDALAQDLHQVACLGALLIRQHHAFDPRRFLTFEPIEPEYEAFLRQEWQRPETVILVAQWAPTDPIVGYAYGSIEPKNYQTLLASCGHLHDLFVDSDQRGRGVATALVNQIVRRFQHRGAPRVVLGTASQNQTGQRLFRKLGFRPTLVEMTLETTKEMAP